MPKSLPQSVDAALNAINALIGSRKVLLSTLAAIGTARAPGTADLLYRIYPLEEQVSHRIQDLTAALQAPLALVSGVEDRIKEETARAMWEGYVVGVMAAERPDLIAAEPEAVNAYARLEAHALANSTPSRPAH